MNYLELLVSFSVTRNEYLKVKITLRTGEKYDLDHLCENFRRLDFVLSDQFAKWVGRFEYDPAADDSQTVFFRKLPDHSDSCFKGESGHLGDILTTIRYLLVAVFFFVVRQTKQHSCDPLLGGWRGEYLNRIDAVTQDAAHPVHDCR